MVWEALEPAKYIVELSSQEVQDIRAAVIKVKSMFPLNRVYSAPADHG
jgi:hypothetical protein